MALVRVNVYILRVEYKNRDCQLFKRKSPLNTKSVFILNLIQLLNLVRSKKHGLSLSIFYFLKNKTQK
jgi:hypothetical protein